jgi:hypothetical protein
MGNCLMQDLLLELGEFGVDRTSSLSSNNGEFRSK